MIIKQGYPTKIIGRFPVGGEKYYTSRPRHKNVLSVKKLDGVLCYVR